MTATGPGAAGRAVAGVLPMGVVRLALALLVVGTHVGGMGHTPAGTTAIAGFFTISGYLMARTIADNYRGAAGRFYLNRVIRIVPPLLAVMLLTWIALVARDGQSFQHQLVDGRPAGAYMPVTLPASPWRHLVLAFPGFPLFVSPSVALLPQGWSLVTEGVFYLAAPLIVSLTLRPDAPRWRWLIVAASCALAGVAYADGENWLRSPFAALWVFWLGVEGYRLARARTGTAPLAASTAGALVLAIGCGLTGVPDRVAAMLVPLLTGAWLVLGQPDRLPASRWDRRLGNLAYGVFLGHFLSTIAMYWVAEAVYAAGGPFGVFGVPDVTEWRLRASSFACAVLVGAGVYLVVERPLERWRTRVRRGGPPAQDAATASAAATAV